MTITITPIFRKRLRHALNALAIVVACIGWTVDVRIFASLPTRTILTESLVMITFMAALGLRLGAMELGGEATHADIRVHQALIAFAALGLSFILVGGLV